MFEGDLAMCDEPLIELTAGILHPYLHSGGFSHGSRYIRSVSLSPK